MRARSEDDDSGAADKIDNSLGTAGRVLTTATIEGTIGDESSYWRVLHCVQIDRS
jgi:hypothetical protein